MKCFFYLIKSFNFSRVTLLVAKRGAVPYMSKNLVDPPKHCILLHFVLLVHIRKTSILIYSWKKDQYFTENEKFLKIQLLCQLIEDTPRSFRDIFSWRIYSVSEHFRLPWHKRISLNQSHGRIWTSYLCENVIQNSSKKASETSEYSFKEHLLRSQILV